jgi:hypothetical protein
MAWTWQPDDAASAVASFDLCRRTSSIACFAAATSRGSGVVEACPQVTAKKGDCVGSPVCRTTTICAVLGDAVSLGDIHQYSLLPLA